MRLHPVLVCFVALALSACIQPRGTATGVAPSGATGAATARAAAPAVASTLSAKGVMRCQAEIGDLLATNFRGSVDISVLTPEGQDGAGSIAILPVGATHPRLVMVTYAPGADGGACDLQTLATTAIGAGCGALPPKTLSDTKIRAQHGKDLLQGGRTPTEGVLLKDINGAQCLSLAMNGSGPQAAPAARINAPTGAAATLAQAGVTRCAAQIAGVVASNIQGNAQLETLTSDAAARSGAVAFWAAGDFHPKMHLLSYFERPGGVCALKMTTVVTLAGQCTALPASVLQGGAITRRFGDDVMQGSAGTARNFMFKDLDGRSCVAFDFL
jgi:hypothetical protein